MSQFQLIIDKQLFVKFMNTLFFQTVHQLVSDTVMKSIFVKKNALFENEDELLLLHEFVIFQRTIIGCFDVGIFR